MRYLLAIVVMCTLGCFTAAMAQDPEPMDTNMTYWTVEVSSDGQNWESVEVTVPVNDYEEVVFTSGSVYVWGPEFNELLLPTQAGTLCRCSAHMSMKCQCGNYCRGSYTYFNWDRMRWDVKHFSGTCI